MSFFFFSFKRVFCAKRGNCLIDNLHIHIFTITNISIIYYHHNVLAGFYMYIETSIPRQQGDNAKLQVSVSGNGAAACLVFYYHMYGDTIGTLNVYSGYELVFNVSGNQGNYWIRARETIYLRHSVSFKVYSKFIKFDSQENATVGIN